MDLIAKGLDLPHSGAAGIRAGRIMLERMESLASRGADFAIETTLAGRTLARKLAGLHRRGASIHLFFLWLPSPELAVVRVADRVRMGGHDIPDNVIRRRYVSGIDNLFAVYLPLADFWRIYDNSTLEGPVLVASGQLNQPPKIEDHAKWNGIADGRWNEI